MYNSNYYVAVDDMGQPYIAHVSSRSSVSSDGGGHRRHKFLAKFDNFFDNGKAFYAYTQQQVQQAMNRGRNKAKYLKAKATVEARAAKYKAGQKVNNVREKAKDILGYDERERRNEALERRNRGTSSKNLQKARDYDFKVAQDEYSKTLLGRVEYLKSAMKVASSIAKRHANDTLASIREKFNNSAAGKALKYGKAKATVETRAAAYHVKKHANETLSDIREATNKAVDTAKNSKAGKALEYATAKANVEARAAKYKAGQKVENVKDRANEIIKNATQGGNIKQQRENLQASYNAAIANGEDQLAEMLRPQLEKLNKEYTNTWLSKGERGVNNVRKKLS